MQFAAQVFDRLKSSTIWLFLPALFLAGAIGGTVMAYDPLMFDADAYAAQAAPTPSLSKTSAEEAGSGETAGTPADSSVAKTSAAPSGLSLADGSFTGYAPCGVGNGDGWKAYYVAVTITVKGGKVASIDNIVGSSKGNGKALSWDAAENQKYLDWAISGKGASTGVKIQLDSAIAAGKTPSGIDVVSGATYSSVAIYNAYADALKRSAKKAGSQTTEQPELPVPSSSSSGGPSSSSSSSTAQIVADDVIEANALEDGDWVGYAACGIGNDEEWSPYYVAVTIRVAGGAVAGIVDIAGSSTGEAGSAELHWDPAENKAYLDWAAHGRTRSGVEYAGVLDQVASALAAGNSPTSIDTVSGATYSSESILKAYYAALAKSAAAAGTTFEDPTGDTASGAGDPGRDAPEDDPGDGGEGEPVEDEPEEGEPVEGDPAPDEGEDGHGTPAAGLPSIYGDFADGTYRGSAFCADLDEPGVYSPYYLFVEITVQEGRVVSIDDVYGDAEGVVDPAYRYDAHENATYLNKAIKGFGVRTKGVKSKIQAYLDAGDEVAKVDTVTGATWSSKSIYEAFAAAIAEAAASSGE